MSYPPWRGLPSADAVHMAAGLEAGLEQLLDICGPESVDEADSAGWTALHRSAAEGDAQRVRRLLAHGADVAALTSGGETPLVLALAGGHTACITEMACAGAANQLNRNGLHALHVAIRSGDAAGVQALLDAAAEEGQAVLTALALACSRTAEPAQTTWNVPCKSPACLAMEAGHFGILRLLLEAAPCAAEFRPPYETYLLHQAVIRRQPEAVRLLLQAAPAIVYQRGSWRVPDTWIYAALPIHMAAHNGDLDSMAALLEAAPNTATEGSMPTGLRPLHLAAKQGHDEAVARLLQAAPEMATVVQPYPPLYAAAQGGHVPVVRRLLQAAPETAMQPAAAAPCQLPLHVAVAGGHVEVARLLVQAKPAAVEEQDSDGCTPISLALLSELPSGAREALLHSLLAAYADGGMEGAGQDAQLRLVEEMGRCLAADNLGAARALLPCMPCTLPLLELLADYNVGGTGLERSLYVQLIEQQPLGEAEWEAVPYGCPGLAGALPAVLARSEAEAGRLVAHLSTGERQRLRVAALCLNRASRRQLPIELISRILVEVVAGPHSHAALTERRRQEQQLADRVRTKHASYFEPHHWLPGMGGGAPWLDYPDDYMSSEDEEEWEDEEAAFGPAAAGGAPYSDEESSSEEEETEEEGSEGSGQQGGAAG
ncbi:serine threonine- phosphatase 6 regulatory ankyrin repeat subunit B-like [Chlorella sorokiniana]|uniref:Serine threonine-phosphatase 6 regulatory ankyrin repeat subunit B-like n=1 Tax=Chlorella sorokiniana TaxID=3076 RepID=A0A2P6TGS9_CHLSO|nr:serine threonine- phosphatase 6 regulatory ankyrin repeat subunit B-like [Chlorella sorokiniana]|eukprot:PRW33315.1 serine threonine- phosphatase 6 regulatory ankyrin repeat subunit B-like [Chlorella sorokiniana]